MVGPHDTASPAGRSRRTLLRSGLLLGLGSPIWNVRPPMIMSTFAESYTFTGITVHPFVTYAVSGLRSTERVYTAACRGARGHRAGRGGTVLDVLTVAAIALPARSRR